MPGHIVILGAGPCGLGAAYRLQELGHADFTVVDRGSEAGGLAGSTTDDAGFVWDYGCHVLYSRSEYFNRVMDETLPGEWILQPRDAQVWMAERFVPYPLQYNVHHLPADMRRECVLGLAKAATRSENGEDTSFHDWIVNGFGDGLAKHFMVPYNEKVWAHPLEDMAFHWIAERVPRPDLTRVLTNLLDQKDDDAWGPNAQFRYPKKGGIGRIWRRMIEGLPQEKIRFGCTATRIDVSERKLVLETGDGIAYDELISTLPLDRLVELGRLDALKEPAGKLRSSAVHVVGIGIRGELPKQLQDRKWMYFPEDKMPFYRMTVLSNFAEQNAPVGHWSLLAEVSKSRHRTVDDAHVVEDVVAALLREGFVADEGSIVSRFHFLAAPGYPTPTKTRDAALAHLHSELEKLGIHSRGRFGAWRYEIANQDHVFLQGAELAGHLVAGEDQPTINS